MQKLRSVIQTLLTNSVDKLTVGEVAAGVNYLLETQGEGEGEGEEVGFDTADGIKGGGLYDKWWVVADVSKPSGDYFLWENQQSNTRSRSTTWRCKECHGWDYKGIDGAYSGENSHRTGFTGIFGTALTAQQIFDSLKIYHQFGELTDLTDADLWDLTRFVVEGQINTDDIIDGEGAFIGDAAAGEAIYTAATPDCVTCQGTEGLTPPPGAGANYDNFVGTISIDNPWEFQHKVRFGQPGSEQPPLQDELSTSEVGDLGVYSQTLPTE